MEDEIIKKLRIALEEPIDRECQVVYIMVEIRKIIERLNLSNYNELKFYCDWTVHTKKSTITKQVELKMGKIYKEIQTVDATKNGIISRKDSFDFNFMSDLKNEMARFLNDFSLPRKILELENWNSFSKLFKVILSDQEIEKPCDGIEYAKFSDDLKLKVRYRDKNGEYGIHQFP